jgi:hypothetical protein
MAFDATVADLLTTAMVGNIQQGVALTTTVDRNLVQGLGVVNTAVIQAQASVSDDSGLIAALQTASRTPVQGSNDLPK